MTLPRVRTRDKHNDATEFEFKNATVNQKKEDQKCDGRNRKKGKNITYHSSLHTPPFELISSLDPALV